MTNENNIVKYIRFGFIGISVLLILYYFLSIALGYGSVSSQVYNGKKKVKGDVVVYDYSATNYKELENANGQLPSVHQVEYDIVFDKAFNSRVVAPNSSFIAMTFIFLTSVVFIVGLLYGFVLDLKSGLIAIGAFVVMLILYFIASSASSGDIANPAWEENGITSSTVKSVDGGLVVVYILLAVAALMLLADIVMSFVRR